MQTLVSECPVQGYVHVDYKADVHRKRISKPSAIIDQVVLSFTFAHLILNKTHLSEEQSVKDCDLFGERNLRREVSAPFRFVINKSQLADWTNKTVNFFCNFV